MTKLVQLSWACLALIHALPALVLFRPAMIAQLYGIDAGGTPHLLLHHRAALFLGVLILCVWSIVSATPRPAAVIVTAISMLSFLLLYWQAGSPLSLRMIFISDLVGVVPLALVGWAAFRS